MPEDIRHPLFARFFDRLSRAIEPEIGRWRDELLEGLTGRVLEIGAGNGINFRHYPSSVAEVVAIEPEPYLRGKAREAALGAAVPVTVQAGDALKLELPDRSFDAAVACLVLCSVHDQRAALEELRRVLKPGGQLRFLEHVRARGGAKARLQTIADVSGLWPRLSGGCHSSRETTAAIEATGYKLDHVHALDFGPAWILTNPHVLGVATLGAATP